MKTEKQYNSYLSAEKQPLKVKQVSSISWKQMSIFGIPLAGIIVYLLTFYFYVILAPDCSTTAAVASRVSQSELESSGGQLSTWTTPRGSGSFNLCNDGRSRDVLLSKVTPHHTIDATSTIKFGKCATKFQTKPARIADIIWVQDAYSEYTLGSILFVEGDMCQCTTLSSNHDFDICVIGVDANAQLSYASNQLSIDTCTGAGDTDMVTSSTGKLSISDVCESSPSRVTVNNANPQYHKLSSSTDLNIRYSLKSKFISFNTSQIGFGSVLTVEQKIPASSRWMDRSVYIAMGDGDQCWCNPERTVCSVGMDADCCVKFECNGISYWLEEGCVI